MTSESEPSRSRKEKGMHRPALMLSCDNFSVPGSKSGVARVLPIMAGWYIGLSLSYGLLFLLLQNSGSFLEPKKELCFQKWYINSKGDCSRGDLAAFLITCIVAMSYLAYKGTMAWYSVTLTPPVPFTMIRTKTSYHEAETIAPKMMTTPQGRIFDRMEVCEEICAVNIAFQSWFLLAGSQLFGMNHPMLLNQPVTAILCWWGLNHQYLHYYLVVFIGMGNLYYVSTVGASFFGYFPSTLGFHHLNILCQALSYLLFVIYRCFLWWKWSIQLWRDTRIVWKSGMTQQARPGKSYVLRTFLVVMLANGIISAGIGIWTLWLKLTTLYLWVLAYMDWN